MPSLFGHWSSSMSVQNREVTLYLWLGSINQIVFVFPLFPVQSVLEEKMGQLIEQGQLEEAVAVSDTLAQRDFALNVATAFDCREYVEKKRVSVLTRMIIRATMDYILRP